MPRRQRFDLPTPRAPPTGVRFVDLHRVTGHCDRRRSSTWPKKYAVDPVGVPTERGRNQPLSAASSSRPQISVPIGALGNAATGLRSGRRRAAAGRWTARGFHEKAYRFRPQPPRRVATPALPRMTRRRRSTAPGSAVLVRSSFAAPSQTDQEMATAASSAPAPRPAGRSGWGVRRFTRYPMPVARTTGGAKIAWSHWRPWAARTDRLAEAQRQVVSTAFASACGVAMRRSAALGNNTGGRRQGRHPHLRRRGQRLVAVHAEKPHRLRRSRLGLMGPRRWVGTGQPLRRLRPAVSIPASRTPQVRHPLLWAPCLPTTNRIGGSCPVSLCHMKATPTQGWQALNVTIGFRARPV